MYVGRDTVNQFRTAGIKMINIALLKIIMKFLENGRNFTEKGRKNAINGENSMSKKLAFSYLTED